jgi:Asp-tRNA(Asn)/Glu-tRNA(Gln) amidotransferase A subunit family amidase
MSDTISVSHHVVRWSIDTGASFEDFRARFETAVPIVDMDHMAQLRAAQADWEAPAIADQWEFTVAGETVQHPFLSKNTITASGAGIPGITLPTGLTTSGLPIRIELDGAHGRDQELRLALRVESILGPLPSPA